MAIRTAFHPHADGSFTIQRRDDAEPTIERNKVLQNTPQRTESFHHIASIPAIVIEKWMMEGGVPVLSMPEHEFKKFIRRKLRDPEWQFLKTTDKRL